MLEKWGQSNEEKVLMHYALLTGCDYYTMKGVGPVAACLILMKTKTLSTADVLTSAAANAPKAYKGTAAETELYENGVICFTHAIVFDPELQSNVALSGRRLVRGANNNRILSVVGTLGVDQVACYRS